MGASMSSNAASAVTNVTNSISQSTTADTTQVNRINNQANFDNCTIIADNFQLKQLAETTISNTQILKAKQNNSIQNKIAQKLAQEALSKIGSLGIGYASASNDVNVMANASTTVIDAMAASAQQLSYVNNIVDCNKSTISANNIFINQGASSNFLSDQILDNDQIVNLINDIDQDVSQKAKSSVSGILDMLFLIIIAVSILMFSSSSALSSRSVVIVVVFTFIILTILLFIHMYIKQIPPFFSKPNECVYGSNIGGCNEQCVNLHTQVMYIKSPPLRYSYDIIKVSNSVNMLDMVISYVSDSNPINGGYNKANYIDFEDTKNKGKWVFDTFYDKYGLGNNIEQLPNPLTLTYLGDSTNYIIPNAFKQGYDGINCTPSIVKTCKSSYDQVKNCDVVNNVPCQTSTNNDDPGEILAMANFSDWTEYLHKGDEEEQKRRILHARFVLSMKLDFPCNIYIYKNNELVSFVDENSDIITGIAKDHTDTCLRFSGFSAPSSFINRIPNGGGSLSGNIGFCNTNSYKFQKFMKKAGIWIVLFVIFLIIVYVILRGLRTNVN